MRVSSSPEATGQAERRLDVQLEEGLAAPGRHLLARFLFGASEESGPGDITVALPLLGGVSLAEHWYCATPVARLRAGDAEIFRCEELMLVHLCLEDGGDLREMSRDAYRKLLTLISESPHPYLIKAWNHVPRINAGAGDQERYKLFCQGRAEALDEHRDLAIPPAGTAVGSPAGSPLQIICLCGRSRARPLENPRQLSAYRYPRQYGPRSPSFSRGTLHHANPGQTAFISGTAAIVGHESRHENSLSRQVEETLTNWRQLLGQLGAGSTQPGLEDVDVFRVYLRHARQLNAIHELLARHAIDPARTVILQADICRRELLFELDGILRP